MGVGARPGAEGVRLGSAHPRRLSTRGRLYVAFAILAAAFVAAFALQLRSLGAIGRALANMDELDEGKRLALEIEREVRNQFVREAHVAAGDEAHFGKAREANAEIARLVAELEAEVTGAEAKARAAAIAGATRELHHLFEEAMALSAMQASGFATQRLHDATYRLVYDVEENADALFGILQERDVKECAVVDRVRRATAAFGVVFLLAFPVLAVAFATHLSRAVARPLRLLGEGAARIEGGDLGTPVDVDGPEEFDVLAAQVNSMAAKLKRNQEELVRAETFAALGRMAAGIAHEINNPLQVMLGYLSLYRGRVDGDLGCDLERMEREASRCREIVGSLLQLARPQVPQPAGPVDLRELSEDVARALRIATRGSAPAVRVVGEGTARGSPLAIRQVLVNLARNALDAAGSAGAVEIRVGTDGSRAFASVSDTGPGVPAEHRERIFEPFFTTKGAGTGLGLPIARSIAAALGGDLVLEPDEERGARFTLRLPLASGGRP